MEARAYIVHSTTVAAWYRFGNLYGVPWNFGERSAAGPVRLTSPHRQVTCQPGMEYGVLGEYQRRACVDVDGLGTCRVKQQTRSTGNSIGIVHGTGHRTGRVRSDLPEEDTTYGVPRGDLDCTEYMHSTGLFSLPEGRKEQVVVSNF